MHPVLYMVPWLETMFAAILPLPALVRAWDTILGCERAIVPMVAAAIMGELRERLLECTEMGECLQFFSAFNSGSTSVLEDAHEAGGRAGEDFVGVQPTQSQATTGSPDRDRPRPASTHGLELVIGAAGPALSPAAASAAAPLTFDMRACVSNALRMYEHTPPSLYRAMVEVGGGGVSPLGFASVLARRRSSAPQGGRRTSGAAPGRARVSSTSAGFGDTMLLSISRAELSLCATRACVLDISAGTALSTTPPANGSSSANADLRSVAPAAWLHLPFPTIMRRVAESSGRKVTKTSTLRAMKCAVKGRAFAECLVRELPELIALKGGYIALHHGKGAEDQLRVVHELLLLCSFPSVAVLGEKVFF